RRAARIGLPTTPRQEKDQGAQRFSGAPLGLIAVVPPRFRAKLGIFGITESLPCVEYPVSGKKVRSAPFPSLRVIAESSPAFRCEKRHVPSAAGRLRSADICACDDGIGA